MRGIEENEWDREDTRMTPTWSRYVRVRGDIPDGLKQAIRLCLVSQMEADGYPVWAIEIMECPDGFDPPLILIVASAPMS